MGGFFCVDGESAGEGVGGSVWRELEGGKGGEGVE